MLVLVKDRVKVVLEGKRRGFGVPSGRGDCALAARFPVDGFGRGQCAAPLEHAVHPDIVQLLVEPWGFPDEVMRKICPAEIGEVDCPELSAQPVFPGEGSEARPVLLPEPPAFFRPAARPLYILLEQLPLIAGLIDRLRINRQDADVFIQVDPHAITPPPKSSAWHRSAGRASGVPTRGFP